MKKNSFEIWPYSLIHSPWKAHPVKLSSLQQSIENLQNIFNVVTDINKAHLLTVNF